MRLQPKHYSIPPKNLPMSPLTSGSLVRPTSIAPTTTTVPITVALALIAFAIACIVLVTASMIALSTSVNDGELDIIKLIAK